MLLCLWNRKAKALQPLNQNGRIPDSQTPPGPTYLPSKHTCHAMISEKRPLVACECRTHNPQLFPLANSSEPKSCPFSRTKTLDPKPKDHTPHNFRTNTCVGVPWIVVAVAVHGKAATVVQRKELHRRLAGRVFFKILLNVAFASSVHNDVQRRKHRTRSNYVTASLVIFTLFPVSQQPISVCIWAHLPCEPTTFETLGIS